MLHFALFQNANDIKRVLKWLDSGRVGVQEPKKRLFLCYVNMFPEGTTFLLHLHPLESFSARFFHLTFHLHEFGSNSLLSFGSFKYLTFPTLLSLEYQNFGSLF